MRHVFVETNWVFGYAAPAHRKDLNGVALLRRAQAGEFRLHLPSPCLTEARQAIVWKCQPREESKAVRLFLARAEAEEKISSEHLHIVRETLANFDRQLHAELSQLDQVFDDLLRQQALEVYPLNETMLAKAVELAVLDLYLKPFDQAILAAVLGRAEELRASGETDLCFCEIDADLQPWDNEKNRKLPIADLYDRAGVWVYRQFGLLTPARPADWPEPRGGDA